MRFRRLLALVLSIVIVANSALPAFATEIVSEESILEEEASMETEEEAVESEEIFDGVGNSSEDVLIVSEERNNELLEATETGSDDIASGFVRNNKGGVSWRIDANNHLYVSGKGEFNVWIGGMYYGPPWGPHGKKIKTATIELSEVENINELFIECSNLVSADLSKCDTSLVTDMSNLFSDCESLQTVDLTGFNTSNVTNMEEMFSECYCLRELDLSSFDTSNVTNMESMFYACESLYELDLSNFNTSNVTNMKNMFWSCYRMSKLDVSSFNTKNVTSMEAMFHDCRLVNELDVSGFDTSQVTAMNSMFSLCNNVDKLDVSGFDTSNVENMSYMFYSCQDVDKLNVSGFDTSNVTNMSGMFSGCSDILELDVKAFNTSNVTDMTSMFNGMKSLLGINVSGFNTSNVTNMSGMFSTCLSLTEIVLSGFDTSQVTDMSYMFESCKSLRKVNLSGLDTSQLTTMESMFNNCSSLTELDLSTFDLSGLRHNHSSYVVYSCDNLQIIKVPPMIPSSIRIYLGGTWYSSDGKQWDYLPRNLEKSIVIQKGSIPTDDFESEDDTTDDTVPNGINIDGLEINGKGHAYARFLLKDNSDKVLKNQEVYYSFGDESVSAISDKNGYVTIKTPELKNTTGKTENAKLEAKLKLPTTSGYDALNYTVKVNVAVQPLSFSQKWELGSGGSLGASAGASAKAGIGAAEAKASLAEIGGKVSTSGRLSVENSYDKGQRDLILFQNYNLKIIGKSELGPTAEIGLLGSKGKLDALTASGEVKIGSMGGLGLKVENYDPTNKEQVAKIGKFLVGSMAQASGNYMLMLATTAMGFDHYNQISSGHDVEVGAGVGAGKVSFSDKSIGELANLGTKKVLSHSLETDLIEQSSKRTFEMTENIEGGLGSIAHTNVNIISEQMDRSMKLTATQKNGKLDEITVEGITEDESGKLLWKEKETKNIKVSYEGEEAEKLYQDIPELKSFVKGDKYFFLDSARKKLLKDFDQSSADGKYAETIEKEKLWSGGLSFELGLGVGVDLGYSLEGINSYEFETETGDYIDGVKYVSSETDIESLVQSKKMTLEELVKEPLETIAVVLKEYLNVVSGNIKEGVSNAGAALKGAAENTKDWILHIVSPDKGQMNLNAVQCYEIATLSLEDESEGVALTIGDPYIVYVTDQNGAEVTDYSESPLELSLSYTDEMLYAAGATAQDVDYIAVYLHSEEKCGYVYVGGIVDAEKKTVSVNITQPGQYVLAIDTLSPEINDFNVSDASKTPTIQVGFEEMSSFREFSMKIDGQEVINSQNWEDYFEGSQKRISYTVENELSEGEHTVSVYAVDSAGNAMKDVATFSFVVDTELPELSKVVVSVDDKTLRVRTWSDHLDVKSAIAKISWTNDKEETVTKEYAMDMMEGYYTVMCKPENNALFATVSVITVDGFGNRCESEAIIKNFENLEEDVTNDLWIRFIDGNGTERSEYEYAGTQIKPKVQIFEGTDLLTEKTDYTVSYSKNVNVGTATITVNGKGNYKGKATENFTIVPKDIGAEDVVAEDIAVAANGKVQLKVPVIKFGKLKLSNSKNKDFMVSWPDTSEGAYKETGTYVIKVTGNGNFTGEREVQLLIGGKTASKLSVSKIASQTYTGAAIEIPGLIIKDGKTILTENVDYTVSYADNTKIGTAKVIITGIAPKYIGSKTVTFKITGIAMSKVKIETETLPKSVTYNGQVREPELKLYYQKDKKSEKVDLVKDVDYKIAYSKNQNAGNATIDIEGIGAYSGKIKKTFTIKPYDVKTNDTGLLYVEGIEPVLYAKGGAKPQPTVTFDGKELEVGKDYTLSYSNNKVVTGEKTKKLPKVTLKFKGNFKNSISEEFIIEAQSLDNMSISVADKVYSKKKNAWKSSPVITDLDGKKLAVGTDYEKTLLYYLDAKCTQPVEKEVLDAGTGVWVKAVGKNNYANSEIVTGYRIVASSIKTAKVTMSVQQYTGKAIEPDYQDIKSVKVNKQVLEAGTDYEIVANSYQNNIKTGTATMKIRGKGNYGDVLTVKFSIQKKNFIWRWFDENVL